MDKRVWTNWLLDELAIGRSRHWTKWDWTNWEWTKLEWMNWLLDKVGVDKVAVLPRICHLGTVVVPVSKFGGRKWGTENIWEGAKSKKKKSA